MTDTDDFGLHTLKPAPGSRKARKRVGRGEGSGTGKTSGRGQKGAGSRSGSKQRSNFEGGQMPIHMRMRKLRGPHMKKSMPFEPFRTYTQPVNLRDLERRTSDVYDEVERLVLEYAEAMSETPVRVTDEMVEALRRHLSERQVVELTAYIALEHSRARQNAALGIAPQGYSAAGCAVPQTVERLDA